VSTSENCRASLHRLSQEERNVALPNREEIEKRVIEMIAQQLGVNRDEIKRETNILTDLNADSLDVVELLMELEEEFQIKIPDAEQEKIQTVGQAIDLIERLLQEKAQQEVQQPAER
jgi:acyl carrier protein